MRLVSATLTIFAVLLWLVILALRLSGQPLDAVGPLYALPCDMFVLAGSLRLIDAEIET